MLGDNDPPHRTAFSKVSFYPALVTEDLTDDGIRSSTNFKLNNDEASVTIFSKYIDVADGSGILNPISAIVIYK